MLGAFFLSAVADLLEKLSMGEGMSQVDGFFSLFLFL